MGTLTQDILLLKNETALHSITPLRLGGILERMSFSNLPDNVIPIVVNGEPKNSGWTAWENDSKKHFGLPNKPILTYFPAQQETQVGESSPKLEIGRSSTRINLGNNTPTIQIGKYVNYMEIGKNSNNIIFGDSSQHTIVGRNSAKATFGGSTEQVYIGGGSILQRIQVGKEVGYLKIQRAGSTNKMYLTPKGGELHLGVGKQGDLALDKIYIGYRGIGDVLRAGSSPNYYHLASDPSKNINNRFMRVRVAEYVHDAEFGSSTRYVYLGHQAEKVYLRGTETYVDSVPNGSYGDIGGVLAVNNAGKVYKINENNFRSWLGIFDIVEMINNINHRINELEQRTESLENLHSSGVLAIGINQLN